MLFEIKPKIVKHHTCNVDTQCMSGFICKNYDCIAKRKEGDLCLSSRDEECQCGKCITDEQSWDGICFNEEECENEGKNKLPLFKIYLRHPKFRTNLESYLKPLGSCIK